MFGVPGGHAPKGPEKSQVSTSFHPDIVTQYTLLETQKARWADEVEDDPELTEKVESQVLELAALREGALAYEGPGTKASDLLQRIDTDKAKEFIMTYLTKGQVMGDGVPLALLSTARTSVEKAKEQNRKLQQEGSEMAKRMKPVPQYQSYWDPIVQEAIEAGMFCPLKPMDIPEPSDVDVIAITRKYVEAKGRMSSGQNPFHEHLLSEMPEMTDKDYPTSPLLQLRWMVGKQAGIVKMYAGQWKLLPGPLLLPRWATNKVLQDVDLKYLEKCTWPQSTDEFPLTKVWRAYSNEELQQQLDRGLRPPPSDIRGIFFAHGPSGDGVPATHWVREVQTWDLPNLFAIHGRDFTAKQLWQFWTSLPLVQYSKFRGDKTKERERKAEELLEAKAISRDLLEHLGLPQPRTGKEWKLLHKEMGTFLAAKVYMALTPDFVMQLPVSEAADDIEHLRLRAICDDQIHVPLEQLMGLVYMARIFKDSGMEVVTVHHYWRCNAKVAWTKQVKDEQLAKELEEHCQVRNPEEMVLSLIQICRRRRNQWFSVRCCMYSPHTRTYAELARLSATVLHT